MSEEEDKPKPEGEQQRARDVAKLKEKGERELSLIMVKEERARLATHKEELKGKKLFNENMEQLFVQMEKVLVEAEKLLQSKKDWKEVKPEFDKKFKYLNKLDKELMEQEDLAEQEELARKSFDELLAEILAGEKKIIQLVKRDDQKGVRLELKERLGRFNRVQLALAKKPKKIGDYLKWEQALEAKSLVYLDVEDWNLKEFKKTLDATIAKLDDIKLLEKRAIYKGLSMVEYLQWETIASLKEMIFKNYEFSALSSRQSIMDSIPATKFQAETTETMLGVRKNTSTLWQLFLLLMATILGNFLPSVVEEIFIPLLEQWSWVANLLLVGFVVLLLSLFGLGVVWAIRKIKTIVARV